ncbi:sugar-binding transcriptional regulator [Lapillicoccus jejuensis]|uniref:Transcriptional regulator n=1 Tax=Lapillicoccus jejuensis TaxID=402171 RepID=A0A542E373_9MICO|nr:sugar-binding domain-containing protein [Lapillicoccus jejuensis]TQJ09684.1 transcriptional regulator [Lapillicoccus jejuensis]
METTTSAPSGTAGPAQLVLMATVARRHYVDGRSKIEIADELGISRFKVARLLDAALATGLVRIEIGHPGSIDVDLSGRLREHLSLRTAIVVGTAEQDAGALREVLGTAAGELLTETVTRDDVLGLAWARAVATTVAHVGPLPPVPVVQLTGSLPREDLAATSIEIVRELARHTGGEVSFFYAPFLLPDAATARTLRDQPDIARAHGRFPSVTKAVIGLGRFAAGQSTIYDALDDDARAALEGAGAVADLSGVFLDAEGRVVGRDLTARMICMDADELAHVQDVLAVPYGAAKAPAVLAAARSGLVTTLVTHTAMATELLAQPPVRRPGRG